ncbi:RelA/SpoT family protein [Thermostichus vulcanus]|uniref:Bifunctional (P)ppGpp synthetase/guanosine-3',5'-bis(Diphosphate) 3'-pyrophosphohydrolase n=1 Tax=Thermostichus vulcanus str. 'Rupite' TaxID=2813851 RepID=A0ABT0CAE4_THEVL|nr:bifunctional (p)ppGpp synthetase/guanosine-3',5'-bis(diphosphate) 3'-pyrophosphohydrolase [Thermostichus vulcanus]MCJ2542743.1 bifunctional (p)ppGpp synthetase/guanosine-3',5'-bis(diphosphate) 3'-pyrophosphohydrolase [Thermostichus vulcanus str. 'Rupite']
MGQTAVVATSDRGLDLNSLDFEAPGWLRALLSGAVDPGDGLRPYTPEEADLLRRAFEFSYCLHQGQKRKSGDPYIAHPVAVAGLLRDLGGDAVTVAAGFLHDVVEDTEVTLEALESEFGAEVRLLVEGVTKLSKFNFSSKTEQQAENFRRMFVAMAKDIRVIVVKLADRLHNMRTLQYLAPSKQRQIAAETMEIFAPLANRLGIWHFKWELEDLAFKYLDYEAYRQIQELVNAKRTEREAELQAFIEKLRQHLIEAGIEHFEISGRPKHLYGIYRKMQQQRKEFHEIYDLSAVRVIVQTNSECYRALAVVHNCFRPIPGRFKDYIGLPKPNRYQSLHTAVIGPQGLPVEVQLRTEEMHRVAEYGIAAHWKYKEAGSIAVKPDEERFTWLRQLLEWQNDLKDDKEYLETIRENLFESEVYVFTPKGDLLALPQGSCPVDFAYRIHSEVGDHCAGARVNNKIVPLDTRLRNGDIVQIITQKNAHPSLDWINFVATSSARNRIRQWFKRSNREQNLLRGRHLLERELGKTGLDALLKSERMQKVAEKLNYASVDDLLAGLGYGETTPTLVINRLQEGAKPEPPPLSSGITQTLLPRSAAPTSRSKTQSPILGVEGLKHQLAKCCNPLPGDPILGVVTRFKGITIHHQDCPRVAQFSGERLVPVRWNQEQLQHNAQIYPVELRLEVIDRVGVLRDILSRLSDQSINVRNAKVQTFANRTALIDLCIDVRDKKQLTQIQSQLRQLSDVIVLRSRHQNGSR